MILKANIGYYISSHSKILPHHEETHERTRLIFIINHKQTPRGLPSVKDTLVIIYEDIGAFIAHSRKKFIKVDNTKHFVLKLSFPHELQKSNATNIIKTWYDKKNL